jgi:hypothetical protein
MLRTRQRPIEREITRAFNDHLCITVRKNTENYGKNDGNNQPKMIEIGNHRKHRKNVRTDNERVNKDWHSKRDFPVPKKLGIIWKSANAGCTAANTGGFPGSIAWKDWITGLTVGVGGGRARPYGRVEIGRHRWIEGIEYSRGNVRGLTEL